MIGLAASLVLVVTTVILVAVLDPSGQWPLGLVNLVAFTAVTTGGWYWQKSRLGGLSPPRWSWGWPELDRRRRGTTLLGVVLAAAGGSVVLGALGNVLVSWWPLPPALQRAFERLTDLSSPWEVLIPLMVVAALTEEGLFRGLLLPSLAQRYGNTSAIALSAFLFAGIHMNPWQGIPALLAGLYLGSLRLSTGGLALPLLAHGLFNGLPLLLALSGLVIPGFNDTAAFRMSGEVPPLVLFVGLGILAAGLALSVRLRLFRPPVF